jgi:cobaltochelatase CobS
MATQIEILQNIIDTSTDPINVENARKELDRLSSIGSAQVQQVAVSGQGDAEVLALLAGLEKALKSGGGGANVSMADIRKAVNEELNLRKITESDLSPSLLALLQSTRKVQLTINKMFGITTTSSASASTLNRPLTQLILSDVMARNNTYLYGGAGTGKTFIAEEIAQLLGWTTILLNCNQFTSPLDILGGQTIEGYQQGKLSMAWSNVIVNPDGREEKVEGVVLILDELPKIDPNTAGILNEALAKVKDFKYDANGNITKRPTIRDGKNRVLELGNLYVIATGNVPLNTIDPDYEANFKQDLSLQDRFIGSTYKVFVDYNYEFNDIMKGYAFIWIFLVKLREAIVDKKATGQAFVSLRLMINIKATYNVYREILNNSKMSKGKISNQAISKPKTIIEAMDYFFQLFKPSTRDVLMQEVDYDGFKNIVQEKDNMPFDPNKPDFDTPQELAEADRIIKKNQAEQKIK